MNAPKRDTHIYLDLERTHLANERTMLSYVRTCFALIFAGFATIRFFDPTKAHIIIASVLIIIGVGMGSIGLVVFWRRKNHYDDLTS